MVNPKQSAETRQALALSEVQSTILNELLDNAKIGILAVDEGHYVAANTYACLLTGYEREDLIGRRVGELNPTSELPEQFAEVLRGARQSGVVAIRAKDGSDVKVCYRAVETSLAGLTLLLGLFWPAD